MVKEERYCLLFGHKNVHHSKTHERDEIAEEASKFMILTFYIFPTRNLQ